MTNKKIITAINETFPSAPNTNIGDSAHFQNGISPPGIIKVNAYVKTIKANITTIAVMKDLALILIPEFSFLSLKVTPHILKNLCSPL